jgi:hypothetical protein
MLPVAAETEAEAIIEDLATEAASCCEPDITNTAKTEGIGRTSLGPKLQPMKQEEGRSRGAYQHNKGQMQVATGVRIVRMQTVISKDLITRTRGKSSNHTFLFILIHKLHCSHNSNSINTLGISKLTNPCSDLICIISTIILWNPLVAL